jgi:alkylation response protein AidB-like acyl-CoA dehydrogenase
MERAVPISQRDSHAYDGSHTETGDLHMKATFQWDDAFRLDDQLDDDERAVRDAAHDYCQSRLQPRVLMAAAPRDVRPSIMTEMGELGLLGSTIDGYGCPALTTSATAWSRARSNASTAATAAR